MSDSEDFLFQINAEELFPEDELSPPKRKRIKVTRKKKKKMKIARAAPNHFIAFRIYDPIIRDRIAHVQNKIIEKNPLLKRALIDLKTLHVSLAVTHLENEEKEKQLRERLRDWGENKMKDYFTEPMRLTFKGIGTFRKEVAFVKINECENYKRLCHLSDAMNDILSDGGFVCERRKEFIPHLTLLKLSKDRKFFYQNKDVVHDIVELKKCEDDFGCQDVRDIQLLSMLAKKDDDGYYKCLWEVKTNESTVEERERN